MAARPASNIACIRGDIETGAQLESSTRPPGFKQNALGGPYLGAYKGSAGGLDLRFGWFRIGIALGSKKPSRRSAFTLGINGHVLFVSSDVSTAATDGTVTNEKKLGVVVLPLIALGYESF